MVAIKDMEMPSCCAKCELEDYHNCLGHYCIKLAERISKDKRDVSKLPNCPLVEIGTCKECEHCRKDFSFTDKPKCLTHGLITVNDDFYCKDFEKRGGENGN